MVVAVVVYWVTPVVLEVPAVAEPVVTGRPLLGCRALRGVVVAVAVTLTQREVTVVLVAPASSSSLGLGPPTQRLSSSPARRRPRSFRRVIGTRRVTVWNVLRVVVVAATAAVRQVAQQPGANQVALPVVTIIRELVAAQLGRVYSQTVKPGQMVVVDRARVVDPARLQAV